MTNNIEKLGRSVIAEVAEVMRHAFLTNPVLVSAFGGRTESHRRRQETMYRVIFDHFSGQLFGVRRGGSIVGVLGMTFWPDCEQDSFKSWTVLPRLLLVLRGLTPRIIDWHSTWAVHHPKRPHWHLGPVAVLPTAQRQGLGSQMVQQFCDHVDRNQAPGYLETDKLDNVTLYERFGFRVNKKADVLGVPNWFMWREPEGFESSSERECKQG